MKTMHACRTRIAAAALLLAAALTPSVAPAQPAGGAAGPTPRSPWRLDGTLYFWLQGVKGDLDAMGHPAHVDASPHDLLQKADYAAEGLVNAQYRRAVLVAEASWTPLTAEKSGAPLPVGMTAELKLKPLIGAAEAGYRVVRQRALTLDALAGVRYWHLGTTLTLTPSPPGNALSTSTDWADPIVGLRTRTFLCPRLNATFAADVGGWDVGSHLDYQLVSGLGYRVLSGWTVDAAWRRLYADYRGDRFQSKTTESGVVFGITRRIR